MAGENVSWLGGMALNLGHEISFKYVSIQYHYVHTTFLFKLSPLGLSGAASSFSFSMRVVRHFSASAMTVFRASSSLLASSSIMVTENSGVPPSLASEIEAGFALWNGIGRLFTFGSGVGGCCVSTFKKDWNGSLKNDFVVLP